MLAINQMMHAQVNCIGKKVVAMQISAFVSAMRKDARAHTIYFRHMSPPPSSTAKRVCFIIMKKKRCISICSISTSVSTTVIKVVAALRSS